MRAKSLLLFSLLFFYLTKIDAQGIQVDEIPLNNIDARMSFEQDDYYILQIDKKTSVGQLKNFHTLGNQWIAMRWKDIQEQGLLLNNQILKFGRLIPSSKISNALDYDFDLNKRYKSHETLWFYVQTWGTKDETQALLKTLEISDFSWDNNSQLLKVSANDRQIKELSQVNFISYIEPISEKRTPLLNTMRSLMNIDIVQSPEPLGLNLKGEDINLGIWDDGIGGFHKDLEENIINVDRNFYGASASQHTTLTTGAILSKGLLRPDFIGAAPKAKAYIYDFFGEVLNQILDANQKYDVFATNHSYNLGDAYRCFYDYQYSTASTQIDQFAIDHPQITNIFAAGNSARDCPYDFKTIVPGFQYGKNVILVGNLQNNETFYPGSAKGPTNDGRFAPHIMAKGSSSFTPTTGFVLPTPVDGYTHGYGTSFASPVVTGVVGLMQEAYLKKHNDYPLNATIKVILCNTAKDIGRKGPDYDYGFGKLDAYQAVKSIIDESYIEDAVSNNEEKSFEIQVPDGVKELKVLITWNDIPASLPNDKVLVNDLDLEVISPERTFLPLVLNPSQPESPAVEARDSVNNIEQVVVKNPPAGTYIIKVKGHFVINSQQDFSISYWLNPDEFKWNYPLKDNILNANERNILRWRAETDISYLDLEYSLDDGHQWISIGRQLPDSNYYTWTTPSGHYRNVVVRALRPDGSVLSVSDKFAISPLLTIKASACFGHITATWDSIGADQYILSVLNDKNEWEDIGVTNENKWIVNHLKLGQEYYFAVRPVFNTWEGKRSYAVKLTYTNAGNCSLDEKEMAVTSITPQEGAIQSDYALKDDETLHFEIRNFSSFPIPNVKLFYQVDQEDVHEVDLNILTKNQVKNYTSTETYHFSKQGIYQVHAWLTSTDTDVISDTLIHYIYQKESAVASFPYFQDFESTDDTLLLTSNTVGIEKAPEWDYIKTGTGRLFNFISSSFSPNGKKALTIDSYMNKSVANNSLYLNIDLSSQQDSLVYLDYKFVQRNGNVVGDSIYIQGNPLNDWMPLASIYQPSAVAGNIYQINRINLSKAIAESNQIFSNHSVLKFTMNTANNTATMSTNGGYTLDDIKIYNGGIDLALDSILTKEVYCVDKNALPFTIPISLVGRNNSPQTIPVGEVFFSIIINGDTVQTETNDAEILPYQTFTHTFNVSVNIDNYKSIEMGADLYFDKDFITENNSIKNQPLNVIQNITHFPLELNFNEDDEIKLVPSGQAYSWELGRPSKHYIYDVADNPGNAYITDLKNFYPPNEESYLYVGCFETKDLTLNSELAFMMIFNTEVGSDGLWMEYSYDGKEWSDVGDSQSGYNWYNEDNYNAWDGDRLIWQVASLPLNEFAPLDPLLSSPIYFRFGFASSEYIEMEGVGIDKFRINTTAEAKIESTSIQVRGISLGKGIVALEKDGIIYAYLDDQGQKLGNITLDIVTTNSNLPTYRDKFLMPRYYHIHTENEVLKPYRLILFNKNTEYLNYLAKDTTIGRMGEIGYLVYDGLNIDTDYRNNHFSQNYTFYHPDSLDFCPYKDGYELRFSMDKKDAEIYLTSHNGNQSAYPILSSIVNLKVERAENEDKTLIQWLTQNDEATIDYIVQYSDDAVNFYDIETIAKNTTGSYLYEDSLHNKNGEHYYRIIAKNDLASYYSLIDSVTIRRAVTNIKNEAAQEWSVTYLGKGYLQYSLNSIHFNNPKYRIIDISGKIIDEWKNSSTENSHTHYSPKLNSKVSGIYILQVLDGKMGTSTKFVKSD
ncbi:MAG: S8 family serine peptidase [Chitinophagales bacterium]|nr:S8 family serine peptidase [Chitinophagales bacterium]